MTTTNGGHGPRRPFASSQPTIGKTKAPAAQELPFENGLASYLHGSITRHEAERLLLASTPEEDGRFLVRVRPTSGRQYRVRILDDGSHTFLTKTLRSTKQGQEQSTSLPSSRRTSMGPTPACPRRSSMAQTLSDMYASSSLSRSGSQDSLVPGGAPRSDSGRSSQDVDGCMMKRESLSATGGVARHDAAIRRTSGMQALAEVVEQASGATPDGPSEPHMEVGSSTTSLGDESRYGSFSAPSGPKHGTIPSATSENFSLGPKDSLHRASVKLLKKMKDMPEGPAWMGHVEQQPRRSSSSTFATMSSVAASFRRKASTDADAPDQYILSVVYRGRCTHHLVSREAHGKPFSINNRMTRCKSLQSVVYMLALTNDERWPVRLQHPVAPIEDPSEVLVEGRMLYSCNNVDAALHCYDKAVATVTRLMAMFPHKEHEYEYILAMAYNLRAAALLNKRRYRNAAEDAHAATTLAPEWWKPHFSEGLALREARDFDEAIAAFQQAHDLLPRGDVKAEQCLTAMRDTRVLLTQAQQELSKQKLTHIEIVRKNTADKDIRKRPPISFGEHISDEGIWYILRKSQLCEEQRRSTFTTAPSTANQGSSDAPASNNSSVPNGGDNNDCVSALCSELKQRTVCVDPAAPTTKDPQDDFELEAPALPDLVKEATALEKLFEERVLPTGRWRVPQQQHVTTWMQWYHLRMGQKLPEYELEERHEKTTDMYSWVLTTAHILRQNIFEDKTPSGSLSMHIVARKPIHEFSAVELCAMLPEMTNINVVQVIPAERLHGELKCDDVLPGDDALPAQHLRVSTISGSYSDLLNADCKHVKKPDLVLFMDSGRRADPQIQADFEDAVDFLTKRKVPIIFTQRFHERHMEVQQWLRDLQVTTASDPKGENPLCSLRAHAKDDGPLAASRFEGQHNGYVLYAPA